MFALPGGYAVAKDPLMTAPTPIAAAGADSPHVRQIPPVRGTGGICAPFPCLLKRLPVTGG
ncbi:hypothetical protein ACFQVD_07125 [Streptosporangium amethystogenes subsp. fukuiense]|uniref:Uncharacterized protein n=1 Tax=Streptosporangium amethystogenes subsp. fukuiense TaxID=698418 RepID=A0ABW2SVU1_9ACTN